MRTIDMARWWLVPVFLVTPVVVGSCGAMKSLQAGTSAVVSKLPKLSLPGSDPEQIKIAKARPQDLRELPLGRDKLLAHEKRRELEYWQAAGDVEFVEPDLPEPGAEMDGSLLPPKLP
jgi:hypothetical protein